MRAPRPGRRATGTRGQHNKHRLAAAYPESLGVFLDLVTEVQVPFVLPQAGRGGGRVWPLQTANKSVFKKAIKKIETSYFGLGDASQPDREPMATRSMNSNGNNHTRHKGWRGGRGL